jgi:4-hydroxy-tetrahydrodipicolinate synthase
MTAPLFKGVITALITPLRDGNVDEAAFVKLLERQIAAGVHGVVPMGTTGESATLHPDEHKRVVELAVSVSAGRTRVIAGAGSSASDKAIEMAAHAKAVGADGVLVVTPYYNRPSQAGMTAHFRAIAEAVQIPLVLYNVPGRTGSDLANETVAALAEHPNIVGLKDATGDMGRISWMHDAIPAQFAYLSGDDASWLGYAAHGGPGVISVTSNVAPEAMVAMHDAIVAGDLATARSWQDRLIGLHQALFLDSSPSPAKYALSRLGLCGEEVRLPLAPTAEAVRPSIDRAMAAAGLT